MTHSFIHSWILSYDRSIASSETSSNRVRSRPSLFHFKVPCLLLKVVQNLLRLSPRLTLTYNFTSIFPSVTCFRRQFLRKMRPIHCSCFSLFVGLIFDNPGPIHQYRDIKTEICNCNTSIHFRKTVS